MNKNPLSTITPFFLLGILIQNSNLNLFVYLITGSFLFINGLVLIRKNRNKYIYTLLTVIQITLLGFYHKSTFARWNRIPETINESAYTVNAKVVSSKVTKEKSRYIIDVERISKTNSQNLKFRILLYTKCALHEDIKTGTLIELKQINFRPLKSNLPSEYMKWLKQNGVQKIIWQNDCSCIKVTEKKLTNSFQYQRENIRSLIKELYPNKDVYGILEALLIGQKTDIKPSIKEIYTRSGAIHILAISGLHVGLIFMVPFIICSRLTNNRFIIYTCCILVVLAFTILVGAGPSVTRAFFMLTLYSIGKILYKSTSVLNILFLTALTLTVFNPYAIYQIGFQLSFLAVFGIIRYNEKITKSLKIKNRVISYFWQLNAVSISAQLGTTGLSLFYFKAFALSFPLSSMIVIPLAPLILILGFGSVLISPISNQLAGTLAMLNNHLVLFQNRVLAEISNMEWLYLENLRINFLEVIMYYTFLFWLARSFKQHLWIKLFVGLLFMIIISVNENYQLHRL